MHSSRMRTVRCSSRLPGLSVQGGVCPGGVCPGWGVVCSGGCLPQCMLGHTSPPLWTEFLTRACEDITFPKLRLRTVKI